MKEHDLNSIRKLARSSLRLNIVLLGAVSLALMLIGACYWALGRVVQEEREKVNSHFSRLVGDIREHEAFLKRIALQSGEAARRHDLSTIPLQQRLLARDQGMEIHEGREFSFAMPFTLARRHAASDRPLTEPGGFYLGVMLANLYSSFWSGSAFPSPQLVVLDLHGQTSLAVPAIGDLRDVAPLTRERYLPAVAQLASTLGAHTPRRTAARVHWARGEGSGQQLLAYISLDVPDELWWGDDPARQVVAATLLDLDGINRYERSLQRPAFDELELVSPGGEVLIDSLGKAADFSDGLNLDRGGLVFKVPASVGGGWSAFYRLTYAGFFQYAKWQFIGGLLVVLSSLVGGWAATRWYKRQVVGPARQARVDILESHAFSRAVIQTVPIALCVLRRSNHEVLMQNRLAGQWLGDAQAITQLSHAWDLKGNAEPAGKEFVLQHGERFLHVTFALTRYRGEEVVLCTFNDITDHRLAQQVLTEAKHSADAASEAKTLFLATMSHEIRTPLYGVLGTLELLGLTDLNRQQRDYLDTIQRSSASLMQLISDVLDVSKIEAGQMALEAQDFDPLGLAEEVVAGFAAVANGKHLQLYACIDANLPRKLRGEANRVRQILNNLLSNALKFTDLGRVVLRLKVVETTAGQATLQWQVTDTGIGMSQEQQQRVFEPFYQAHGHEPSVTGTGLGLSICLRLCELMGGRLQVVSELGLGSSFTFTLQMPVLDGGPALGDQALLQPGVVHVRSPVKELAHSLALWVEAWGATAQMIDTLPEHVAPGAVLLDLLGSAEDSTSWPAVRVCALAEAGQQLQATEGGWVVSLYHLAALAQALQLAQQGVIGDFDPGPVARAAPLGKLGMRVLVAEDNPINQVLLKEQLEELGCQVTLASNGREALARWQPDAFDVLLSDINMPVMNGYELVRALREQGATLPIIGVTANALREEGERCIAVGMNAWLAKPLSLRTLHDGLLGVFPGVQAESRQQEASGLAQETGLQVPASMRELFVATLRQDMLALQQAQQADDLAAVGQQAHRLRGALAVVQAHALSDACAVVEEVLKAGTERSELEPIVAELLENLESALAKL
ncbi:response regulator [Pseudomonas putida]|uniref:histidine kinase n=1 Tax=Pseudomonas putida TaxID=303 RepID=A0A4D6X9I0_PSEPU|nr:hybrid sensor histidine kinase/response regulator [Pseudomonas putida]QCI12533.1 response regulator [Pseudomonas putida]